MSRRGRRHRNLSQYVVAGLLFAFVTTPAVFVQAGDEPASQPSREIPEGKRTTLGLYVTSAEAYERWAAAPERTKILDVRTPEEYIFVGHAEMAWNIPFAYQTYRWDGGRRRFAMEPNPDFVSLVKEWAELTDTIMVMCRSGGRSAMSVDVLAEAGFTNVYNIVDGMEGDMVRDSDSMFYGKRMKNGWKNSGLPWTYDLHREQIRVRQ